jgi:hypothetical protein
MMMMPDEKDSSNGSPAAPTPIPIAFPEPYPPDGATYPYFHQSRPLHPIRSLRHPPPHWADAAAQPAMQMVEIPANRIIQRESIVFSSDWPRSN